MPVKWKISGVLIFLDKTRETVDSVCRFVDFLTGHKYKMLGLDITDGPIGTKSFPYLSGAESFTVTEIKEIVRYADGKGIACMPLMNSLGHAGNFLRYSQMTHLGETRGGRPGRFSEAGAPPTAFCPSLKETYEFFETYLTELAEMFPGEYFHTGHDEAWDIGFCDLCRERAEGKEGQAGIFAKHLRNIHKIIVQKLGKKMLMYDDLFEHYPSVLYGIPKDIIMCTWQFDTQVDVLVGHFANRIRRDNLAIYDHLGFSYVIMPLEQTSTNTVSLTEYAGRHNALGGIMMAWKKHEESLGERYPNIALAGELWNTGDTDAAEQVEETCLRQTFPSADEESLALIKAINSVPTVDPHWNIRDFLVGPVSLEERERFNFVELASKKLAGYLPGAVDETEANVLENIMLRLNIEKLQFALHGLTINTYTCLNGLSSGNRKKLVPAIEQCLDQAASLALRRKAQSQKERLPVTCLNNLYQQLRQDLLRLRDVAAGKDKKNTGLLVIHCFLPDQYSSQTTSFSLLFKENDGWVNVAKGGCKPYLISTYQTRRDYDCPAYYTAYYPIDSEARILACKIDTWGYGGQGITFTEAVNCSGHYYPRDISNIIGHVENPENILVNDLRWCFIGERNTDFALNNAGLARVKHTVVLDLKKNSA